MRSVNLIPPEQRHGAHRPLRTGLLPYIVIGLLVAALVGVAALVITGNEISDRKAEITTLRREDAAAKARAQSLGAYTQFAEVRQKRVATVTSLADSRFDWERVMRELSKVLPSDVWLTSLNATASPEVSVGGGKAGGGSSSSGGGAAAMRSSVKGPALEINGCANGQDGVAGFVTALKEIDGVTRVGVQSSALPAKGSSAGAAGGSSGGGNSDCRTRSFIAQFQIVVAFDAAPIPSTATASSAPVTSAAGASEAAQSASSSTTTASSSGG
jgi:Tfp pilus assembly protein PilN